MVYGISAIVVAGSYAGPELEKEEQTGKEQRGRAPQFPTPKQVQPDAKAQRNFTGPDSRAMPDGAKKGSFVQGHTAQAMADATAR
jgi:hypothetical protein